MVVNKAVNMFQRFQVWVCVFCLAVLLYACRAERGVRTIAMPLSEHLLLGNPSNAVADTGINQNYLMIKPQYALSYNQNRGTPNWVSWHLDPYWIGSAPRQDNFSPDYTLPPTWYKVQTTDYTGSGFDRGHNCPSADRTKSEEDNAATFLMTNIIPQAPDNNQQTWANLENYCRSLVNDGNELYIIMGSYGRGGKGNAGTKTTIANGKVTVPSQVWKVIVVLPQGTDDVTRINAATRVIAINTPNTNSVNSQWGNYRTSVDVIEAATGYNLLSALPESLQLIIEAQIDNGPTN